ncbi:MAG TPA: 50S ribosomal protein L21 [Sphingomicrobium sp.]|nr:50S ribosomal protein L21 [Sphingomicrobium sp.]
MFAVVRTGGKQYRVAPGDKIVVEKLDGSAGDKVTLGDVLLAGDGGKLKSTDGLTVAAEIVAQAKADKVTVFKKRRRHNYRRKKGHRQQHTILRIVAIGDHKHAPSKAEGAEKKAAPKPDPAPGKAATPAKKEKPTDPITPAEGSGDIAGKPTMSPAPQDEAQANPPTDTGTSNDKPVRNKAEGPASGKKSASGGKAAKAAPETASTENAAPAKGAAKKSPKKK